MKILINIILAGALLYVLFSCTPPTDVDANRTKLIDNQGNDVLNQHISSDPEQIKFIFEQPGEPVTRLFRIINNNPVPYEINRIYFKNSVPFFKKHHHVLPITLDSKYNQYANFESVRIEFDPKEAGTFFEEIYVNDMDKPVASIEAIVMTIKMPEVDFGYVTPDSSKKMMVSFKNYGKNSAFITGAQLSDPEGVFTYENIKFPAEIKSKKEFRFWIEFTPDEKKMFTGTLHFDIQSDGYVDDVTELSGMGK